MRALVIYCHPNPASFTAAVRDVVLAHLQGLGADVRVRDLYAEQFDPVLSAKELAGYANAPDNQVPVQSHVDDLLWCDTLIFVYPTWWYGLPAMVKGWLDRVLLPDVAFVMPEPGGTITPGLPQITRLAVFTTCGASRSLSYLIGQPGRRTLLRGVRTLCAKRCKTAYGALYLMDSATPAARARHLTRLRAKLRRFLGSP